VSGAAGVGSPLLGLVCLTQSDAIRYRTITRTRLLGLPADAREPVLRELYRANVLRLQSAIAYCERHEIRLYRIPSGLLPFADHAMGAGAVADREVIAGLGAAGTHAQASGVRIVMHPDQYVVLNSEREDVCRNSVVVLAAEARVLDLLGLPRSPFAAMTIHGGKGGRAEALVAAIRALPPAVRSRLVLENDERAYGAEEILEICRRAAVPMVFDAHHHLVKERLSSYADRSIRRMMEAAATTWPDAAHALVHVSNGRASLHDARHSELIDAMPPAFRDAPYIEVEAKAKEVALADLRSWFPARTTRERHAQRRTVVLDSGSRSRKAGRSRA
jgi:UV DNA damage endonuclease